MEPATPPLGSLYQEIILEHFRSPRNKGALEAASHEAHLHNPVCGDDVHLRVRLEGDRIADLRFTGHGCSISQASVSMMTELLKGKTVDEAETLTRRFNAMMHGDAGAAADRILGNARALSGVAKFPVRIKCALLGWEAFGEALGRPGVGSDVPATAHQDAPQRG